MTDAELDTMIADLRSPDTELFDVADAIDALREQLANAHGVAQACEIRAERAEADNAALREQVAAHNSNSFCPHCNPCRRATEIDNLGAHAALMESLVDAQKERAEKAEADNAALRQVIDNAVNAYDYAECLDFLRTALAAKEKP